MENHENTQKHERQTWKKNLNLQTFLEKKNQEITCEDQKKICRQKTIKNTAIHLKLLKTYDTPQKCLYSIQEP